MRYWVQYWAVLKDIWQYRTIMDNIGQVLYIDGKDERQTHLTRLSQGCPSHDKEQGDLFFEHCRGEYDFLQHRGQYVVRWISTPAFILLSASTLAPCWLSLWYWPWCNLKRYVSGSQWKTEIFFSFWMENLDMFWVLDGKPRYFSGSGWKTAICFWFCLENWNMGSGWKTKVCFRFWIS